MASGFRTERVGRLIQEKIGALIVEGRIKDPRVHPLLSITRVSVSRDLAWVEVYVSNGALSGESLEPGSVTGGLKRGVEGLQSASGFIQAQLAGLMRIRKTPRLRFREDQSIRDGFQLVKKIEALSGAGTGAAAPFPGDPSPEAAGE
jgi:ribosome-binding factor A